MKSITSRPLVIAIDGYSSCGKSTLARQIAKELDYIFIDSGAMYRTVTLYFIEHHISISDESEVEKALDNIHITFQNSCGVNSIFLNGRNVEREIRSLKVSDFVSQVSALSVVRKKLVALQRKMAGEQGIVMDGRDIGTVVFPDADLKFFVTADPLVRAQRRYFEMLSKNQKAELHEVISNLELRDRIDTEREDSPLRQADDAILLDNTNFGIQEQFDFAIDQIVKKFST